MTEVTADISPQELVTMQQKALHSDEMREQGQYVKEALRSYEIAKDEKSEATKAVDEQELNLEEISCRECETQEEKVAHSDEVLAEGLKLKELKNALRMKSEVCSARKKEYEEQVAKLLNMSLEDALRTDPQMKLPFGSTDTVDVDSPVSDLQNLSKSTIQKLKSAGIERIPDLGALIRGENPEYPDGPISIKGMNKLAVDMVVQAYERYRSGDVSVAQEPSRPPEVEPAKEEKSKGKKPKKPKVEPEAAKEDAPPVQEAGDVPVRAKILIEVGDGYPSAGSVVDGVLQSDQSFVTNKKEVYNPNEFEVVEKLETVAP